MIFHAVPNRMISDLERFGALPSQLVDLATDSGPRTLPYLDLANAPPDRARPTVFEVQGRPRAYVFDARERDARTDIPGWIRRIAFRSDADWVGVLRPGRLDIFRAALDGRRDPTAIEEFGQSPMLFPSLVHTRLGTDIPSVRAALLTLLRGSIREATDMGVGGTDALSLVGRAIFWRFLLDRNLLDGIDPQDIASGASSLEACLDNKTRALKTFEWLDRTFNGGLLSFESRASGARIKAEVYDRVVGNIAHGAIGGQLELRLPREWREVNFAHIPIGLLSEVYESYAHGDDEERARAESVFYTPRHIAEFVVDEALSSLEHVERPRVLDPAAGAGVFLVTAFRALVSREWRRSGKKPSRKIVRRILNEQLAGFDINDAALRLAELALYLTAIELDPESRPRPLQLLRFDALRDSVLFQNDVPDGSLAPVEDRFRSRFDLVIGNPPWTATGGVSAKRRWVEGTRSRVHEALGADAAKEFDFPDTNPDLPFVYRATEWAVPKGRIALVTHARWLFGQSERALAARRYLFDLIHVTGVLNGTALRLTSVWPNVTHPFCVLFAVNERPSDGATFQFVSPTLDHAPDRAQHHLRIDWTDASDIATSEVVKRPWLLKARFRGSSFDESVVDHLLGAGTPLGDYLTRLKTRLRNGYIEAPRNPVQHSARDLQKLPDFKHEEPTFHIETATLPRFGRETLHRPRKRQIYNAPLLIVHESIRHDALAPRSMLAFEDMAYDDRFSGISFDKIPDGLRIASYLQLVMQSSVFLHSLLILDSQFGVERELVHKETIERVPVVPWDKLPDEARREVDSLSKRLRNGNDDALLAAIDAFTSDIFDLTDVQRDAISDSLATALPTTASKQNAVRPPLPAERAMFQDTCEYELRELHDTPISVRPLPDLIGPWRFLQIDRTDGRPRTLSTSVPRAFLEAAQDGAASLITINIDQRSAIVGLLDQYRYWTRTRARLLAASLVAEHPDE